MLKLLPYLHIERYFYQIFSCVTIRNKMYITLNTCTNLKHVHKLIINTVQHNYKCFNGKPRILTWHTKHITKNIRQSLQNMNFHVTCLLNNCWQKALNILILYKTSKRQCSIKSLQPAVQ